MWELLKDLRIKVGIAIICFLFLLIYIKKKALASLMNYKTNTNTIIEHMNQLPGKLAFEDKVPIAYRADFIKKIKEVCGRLGINPDWLMSVINKESAGTFSPSIKNPTSSATGLIQFMEATAKGLGTTTAALRKMTAVQQMDYVEKYFQPYKGKMKSFADVYICVFYPAALDKPDTWVFPNWVYKVQKYIDINKDGKITLGEFKKWMNK